MKKEQEKQSIPSYIEKLLEAFNSSSQSPISLDEFQSVILAIQLLSSWEKD